MVQPDLRLGTILGQSKAEEPFDPSGSEPPSYFQALPTCSLWGSAKLTVGPKTWLPSPALQRRAVP